MTDLLYSELEVQLRASVREMLAQRRPVSAVLAGIESGQPYDRDLWRTLAGEMGLAGIAVPERFGGGGASLREAAVVLEELGRGMAPVPYLTSAVVATACLLAGDGVDSELSALAAGEAIAVLAVPFASVPATLPPTGAATVAASGTATAAATAIVPATVPASGAGAAPSVVVDEHGRLTGSVPGIADGLAATLLLVPATDGLYAVDANAPGVDRSPVVSLDLARPLADLRLERVPGRRVGALAAVDAGLTAGAALLASEQLGLAEWCLETTVAYLKERHQFARPLGSFQALKHRLADVWVELTQARAVARHAAVCAAEGDADLPVAASLAQAFCSPMALHAAEEAVQLHGGIGFTWEHPVHLFLKRAKADAIAFGTADRHRVRLAALVDLPA